MLKWLIRNRLAAFERAYEYDLSYARDILAADTRAFLAFSRVMGLSSYHRDVPRDVYWAVKVVGAVTEDCGPCTQLVVTMALRDGAEPRTLAAVLARDDDALPEPVKLGVRFARAVMARDPEADTHRDAILAAWGPRALVSLGFAIVSARIFPTMKYALGHGKACQRVVVAGQPIAVLRGAPA